LIVIWTLYVSYEFEVIYAGIKLPRVTTPAWWK